MSIISLGKIDINIIPIILGSFFYFLLRLLFTIDDIKLFKHAIIPNIYACISKLFTIIPYIILKIRSKGKQKDDIKKENKNDVELIYINTQDELSRGKWTLLLLSSILLVIQGIILVYSLGVKSNSWIWDILITSVFYYLIFRVKLYKHHYVSMIIILSTGLILDLVFENLQNDISNNIGLLLLKFLREILFSLVDVINKYLMEKKFCSVYELTFYSGLMTTILYGIFSILSYYYFNLDDFEDYYNNFNTKELLVGLGVMINSLGVYIFQLFINKNNTPCHLFIIYVFGQLAYYIDFTINSIILIICTIFILLMSLIFNEIIEINVCGLSENTRRKIAIRAAKDNINIDVNTTINSINEKDEITEE